MTGERSPFRSRIARRIVAFFVVSALVPIVASAWLSLDGVRGLLMEQAHASLAETSERYAASIFDRLVAARQQMQELASRQYPSEVWNEGDWRRLHRQFSAIGMVDASGRISPLLDEGGAFGLPYDVPVELPVRGGTLLSSLAGNRGTARILLTVASRQEGGATVVAEIDPEYLWSDADALPATSGLCVVDDRGRRLSCARDEGFAAAQALSRREGVSPSDGFSFEYSDSAYLANHRELNLKSQFGSRTWNVIATRRQADALAPISDFEALFVPVLALALLVAAALSVVDIRRTLGPLRCLAAGIGRTRERNFSTPIAVAGDDDLGELAPDFNSMAARLGSQSAALQTLSEIDQAIRMRLDLERIIETIVMRIRDVVPADGVSIALSDRNVPEMARIYSRDQRSEGRLEIERCVCAAADMSGLLAHPDGVWIDRAQAVKPYLAPVVALGAAVLLVLPIVLHNAVVGTLVLGFRGAALLTDEERARARGLGDRIGVAFATAAKDEQLYYQVSYGVMTALPNRLPISRTGLCAAPRRRNARGGTLRCCSSASTSRCPLPPLRA